MSDNAIHVSAGDAPLVDRSAEGGKPVTVRRGMAGLGGDSDGGGG